MIISVSLIALAVLTRTAWVLSEKAAVRRCTLAACGALQLSFGAVAAAWITLTSLSAEAAEPMTVTPAHSVALDSEEAFFVSSDPNLPDWVSQAKLLPPQADWTAVQTDPCPTVAECDADLTQKVKAAADDFINRRYRWSQAALLLNYDANHLRARLVSPGETYTESRQLSVGDWKLMHAKVEFSPDFLQELDRRWRELQAKLRLGQVGLVSAVVLSLLSTAFGFFKANTATHGQKGSTLQMGAAAMILVIVVAGITAARYMYWI